MAFVLKFTLLRVDFPARIDIVFGQHANNFLKWEITGDTVTFHNMYFSFGATRFSVSMIYCCDTPKNAHLEACDWAKK